jgi:uridine kinase
MKPIFIGIAGGTGAGKSTLCAALVDRYPDEIGLIQLDDYFKPSAEIPRFEGHANWDHPDALFFDKLAGDLAKLSQGKAVIINTKNERLNPHYKKTDKRIPVEFHPKPIMLVEGYLMLFDERVRKFLTTAIWLNVDHETRWARRVHFKSPEYEEKVLRPMHEQFVEPTKQYAAHIIDVSDLSKEQVREKAADIIKKFLCKNSSSRRKIR